jgi:hypothetical protein
MPAENVFCVPSFVDILSMEVDQELTDVQPTNCSIDKVEHFTDTFESHFINIFKL